MQVDPRGQRFAAAVSALVLAVVLASGSAMLLAAQGLVFAVAAVAGVRYSPYGLLYAIHVRPKLGPPRELADAAPLRFAQGVGLAFVVVGLVGYLFAGVWFGGVPTALAFLVAFLNAAFGLCPGCEMYVLLNRLRPPWQGRMTEPSPR
ncbi:hypothetical protein F4561_004978 [Lipingzhangella halophila]|uniref:DUF4395 domain-containing protein n=1 Tax=Lipingzhangella halophila TaxID=1783352 RepID=A0A7W7RLF0_9ACTN|nr:DUF4395 domain-containing protein [Lipingzhangella halophila]MBB4934158.1 hypothetical protein [Lipingzhangella halophila]